MSHTQVLTLLQRPEVAGQSLQRRCFVSSSAANATKVQAAVSRLRAAGWFVYDFTRSDLLSVMRQAGITSFEDAMASPYLRETGQSDMTMLRSLGAADVLLLILPAGFSAGWETGYASGRGARVVVAVEGAPLTDIPLMHADRIAATLDEALDHLIDPPML
ncbi:MAG: hypothetical protein SGJ24_10120 [Chloroflexota bacterium]|nr:hypothetical protein [Chloroflexota bacterium]